MQGTARAACISETYFALTGCQCMPQSTAISVQSALVLHASHFFSARERADVESPAPLSIPCAKNIMTSRTLISEFTPQVYSFWTS